AATKVCPPGGGASLRRRTGCRASADASPQIRAKFSCMRANGVRASGFVTILGLSGSLWRAHVTVRTGLMAAPRERARWSSGAPEAQPLNEGLVTPPRRARTATGNLSIRVESEGMNTLYR